MIVRTIKRFIAHRKKWKAIDDTWKACSRMERKLVDTHEVFHTLPSQYGLAGHRWHRGDGPEDENLMFLASIGRRSLIPDYWTFPELRRAYKYEPERLLEYLDRLQRFVKEHRELYSIYDL